MPTAFNPDLINRWLLEQEAFHQLDSPTQMALRLIPLLVEVDDLTSVMNLLNRLLVRETDDADESSILLIPVIAENEIPEAAKCLDGNVCDSFIGNYNYNKIFTPNLGSEGPIANALRNFSERPQCQSLTAWAPYSSEVFQNGAVKKIVLATDFCASGGQAISSIRRFTDSAAFEEMLEKTADGERPEIVLVSAATTSEAADLIQERAQRWRQSGWNVRFESGKRVLSLWGDWIPEGVRRKLCGALLQLPLHDGKKGRPRNKYRKLAYELWTDLNEGGTGLFEKKRSDPKALAKLGFGYEAAAALYANQMTIPNTLPGFLIQKSDLNPLFPRRRWSNVAVDLKDLIMQRENKRQDPVVRPLLLGTQLTSVSGGQRSGTIFDFSFFSDSLDMLEMLELGIGLSDMHRVYGLTVDEMQRGREMAKTMRAVSSRGDQLELTETGRKVLASARKEIEKLSELKARSVDRKNLAREGFLRYNR